MANLKELEERLKEISCNFRFWGRAELRELANALLPSEIVEICVNGMYEGGFAMLVATDQRVLLIDKKPMYLTLEDVRFDMVAELDYTHRLMDATIFIRTPNKSLRFTAFNQGRLRKLFHFAQTKVMEIRQHYQQQSEIWKEYAASLQQPGSVPQGAVPSEPAPQLAVPATPEASVAERSELAQALQPTTDSVAMEGPAMPAPPPQPPLPYRTVVPIVSAYTRLPIMSRSRRFLGSRAINAPVVSSLYSGQQPPA